MSSEIFVLIEALSFIVTGAILILGTYRAIRIGRAFVNPIYRSRAYWTAIGSLLLAVGVLSSLISPASSTQPALIPLPSSLAVLEALSLPASLGFLAAIFVFVDRTILVAMDMDFFHRSALRWQKVRILFYILLLVSLVEGAGNAYLGSLPPSQISRWEIYAVGSIPTFNGAWFPLFDFTLLAVVFGYAATAMIVAARRTPDRTLRKYVRYLGIGIVSYFVADVTFTFVTYSLSSYPVASLAPDVLFILTAYIFYQFANSLSSLGSVEKETA